MNIPTLSYDAATNILSCEVSGVSLDTPSDIDVFFDEITRYWHRECRDQRVYVLVNYDNFAVNLAHNDAYMTRMGVASNLMALAVIRFGGSVVQRVAARGRAIKSHSPANLYRSREEALEVVRGLQSGEIQLAR